MSDDKTGNDGAARAAVFLDYFFSRNKFCVLSFDDGKLTIAGPGRDNARNDLMGFLRSGDRGAVSELAVAAAVDALSWSSMARDGRSDSAEKPCEAWLDEHMCRSGGARRSFSGKYGKRKAPFDK